MKEGKDVRDKYNYSFKIVDGFIVATYYDDFYIGYTIHSINKPYILEEEPLKIEVGKFYRTRNGSKAFVYAKADKGKYNYWAVIVNSIIDENFCCTVNCTYFVGKESKKDLVAPWEE